VLLARRDVEDGRAADLEHSAGVKTQPGEKDRLRAVVFTSGCAAGSIGSWSTNMPGQWYM